MKNLLKSIGTSLTKATYTVKDKADKYSPEIFIGLGIVGFVGTVIIASKATLKAHEIVEEYEEEMKTINEACEIDEFYAQTDSKKEKTIVCAKTAGKYIKLYAPAVLLGALSLTCFFESNSIMKKRYLGAVAAYNGLSEVFKAYRERVIAENGIEADRHYRYGTDYELISKEVVNEKGKKKTVTEKEETVDSEELKKDPFIRVFDETNENFKENPQMNYYFLRGVENWCTDILRGRGHVFLNEILDRLGFDRVPEGQILGIICRDEREDEVDFGLTDKNLDNVKVRDFMNGRTPVVPIIFDNLEVIWDKI